MNSKLIGAAVATAFFGFKLVIANRSDLSGFQKSMTKEEAKKYHQRSSAHRKIILNNHPDRGGSPYIASKVNEAKEILTKRI
ncbi:hypothetical protein MXB_1528 [Myxobolus squamalis]|nr:hypothetical protein MXB_1528 [Myxobolus squamalis]